MAQLILKSESGEKRFQLDKKLTTVGTEPEHDAVIRARSRGVLFTLVRQDLRFEILPGDGKILLNGKTVSRLTKLDSCDRLEWDGGSAVYLESDTTAAGSLGSPGPKDSIARSLGLLQNLASSLQSPGALGIVLERSLEAFVDMAGAEYGYLLTESAGEGSGWELTVSRQAESAANPGRRRDLFSNTILQEALKKREPVHVENIIGHPWAEAMSVIEARIFSAACFPLIVGDRIFGAVFLFTRSPGRSIKKETLPELSLLATQAALMMATQTQLNSARKENAQLRSLVTRWPSSLVMDPTAGDDHPMAEVLRKIHRLAPTPLSVLILGETGTGKEVVARELHQLSTRSKAPFIAVNCAAIPSTLLESTLFGHEKGAFTGAIRSQPGKFAQAEGGTLFLDEIGDLPLELQAKLLRVLQERCVEPLGATRSIPIDVRILAATHCDLESHVKSGKFRQDLYFRLNGAQLKLPALRERKGDIRALAEHFLRKAGSSLKFSTEALDQMERHSWPGNVRELEQAVLRAGILADGPEISLKDLELEVSSASAFAESRTLESFESLKEAQEFFTRDFVHQILQQSRGNRSLASQKLGISERTLYRILSDSKTDSLV